MGRALSNLGEGCDEKEGGFTRYIAYVYTVCHLCIDIYNIYRERSIWEGR